MNLLSARGASGRSFAASAEAGAADRLNLPVVLLRRWSGRRRTRGLVQILRIAWCSEQQGSAKRGQTYRSGPVYHC